MTHTSLASFTQYSEEHNTLVSPLSHSFSLSLATAVAFYHRFFVRADYISLTSIEYTSHAIHEDTHTQIHTRRKTLVFRFLSSFSFVPVSHLVHVIVVVIVIVCAWAIDKSTQYRSNTREKREKHTTHRTHTHSLISNR